MTIKELKEQNDIVAVVSRYVTLKKDGDDYVGCCPIHNEKTKSFKVHSIKQRYKCFGCGKGGDVLDFLIDIGNTFDEAREMLGNKQFGEIKVSKAANAKKEKMIDWVFSMDSPDHQPTDFSHYKLGQPVKVWSYKNERGAEVSYDCRFEYEEDGQLKKDVLPFTWCTDGSRRQWRWKGMGDKRLPYNYDKLKKFKKKPVIIVEGRKCAQAAEEITSGKSLITTWQGGGSSVDKTDWEVLRDREIVVIWQDNDYPGYKTTMLLVAILKGLNVGKIKFVHNPLGKPKGWDVADAQGEGWSKTLTSDFINSNLFDIPQEIDEHHNILNHGAEKISAGDSRRRDAGSVGDDGVVHAEIAGSSGPGEGNHSGVPGNSGAGATVENELGRTGAGDVAVAPEADGAGSGVVAPDTGRVIPLNVGGAGADAGSNAASGKSVLGSNPKNKPAAGNETAPPRKQNLHGTGEAANPYYKFLGFQNNDGKLVHCFYNLTNRTIIKLSANGMSKAANLLELAPLYYWQKDFPNRRDGIDHTAAVDMLLSISNRAGLFSNSRVRGRGAWMDDGELVVHTGDYLIKGGKYFELGKTQGKYIYEQGTSLGLEVTGPLDNAGATKFLDLVRLLNWERQVNAHLLAGWCVIAPFCGALKWRPHAWITGPAGCGKTWVMGDIVKPMLGGTMLRVQGSTSEAGLRQALRRDALPVGFDEAEGEDNLAQARMQAVLTLMRSSSSEDGGSIIKGTVASGSDAYQIRSCFIYASIGMQAVQQSDRTRITVLGMKAYDNTEERSSHFKDLQKRQVELLTEQYTNAMRSRTMKLWPVIMKNAATFSAAATAELGQQRAGDQLGALLAGAYSLVSDLVVTYEQAVKWIKKHDWEEEHNLAETRDEDRLFTHLMEQRVRADTAFAPTERTVGELVTYVAGMVHQELITNHSANLTLLRCGIRLEVEPTEPDKRIIFSNQSDWIKRVLRDTPWQRNFSSILSRIEGAKKEGPHRFGSYQNQRGVSVPLDYFKN